MNYAMSIRKMLKKLSKSTSRELVEKIRKPDNRLCQVTLLTNPGLIVVSTLKLFLSIKDLTMYNIGRYDFKVSNRRHDYSSNDSQILTRVQFDITEVKSGIHTNVAVYPTAAKIQLNGMVEFTGRMSISEYVGDYIILKELEKIKTDHCHLITQINDRIDRDGRTKEFKRTISPSTKRTNEGTSPDSKRKKTSNKTRFKQLSLINTFSKAMI